MPPREIKKEAEMYKSEKRPLLNKNLLEGLKS